MHPSSHNILLAGGIKTVYRRIDAGTTWTDTGLNGLTVALAASPSQPGLVYAANGGVIYKSEDFGGHWTRIRSMETLARFCQLVCDPTDPAILYACTDQPTPGIAYKSTDGGVNWTQVFSFPNNFIATGMAAISSTTIIVAADDLFMSTDVGASWNDISGSRSTSGLLI